MKEQHLKEFLEEKYELYNTPSFIDNDPIAIPHQYTRKEDIEIAAFLTATIAWGQRKTILVNAERLMRLLENNPYDFVINQTDNLQKLEKRFKDFKHRTFNATDCAFFVLSLANIYKKYGGLEKIFMQANSGRYNFKEGIINFRKTFFSIPYPARTAKHVSNPADNSAAKRINMFLRWMIRKDKRGVDFGVWNKGDKSPEFLFCPLDLHSGRVARKLGILKRKQDDWKAVEELTQKLVSFDKKDPVKYDFALFGLGVYEKF
jgi:uncharacterized protein (TIGR02757 family)